MSHISHKLSLADRLSLPPRPLPVIKNMVGLNDPADKTMSTGSMLTYGIELFVVMGIYILVGSIIAATLATIVHLITNDKGTATITVFPTVLIAMVIFFAYVYRECCKRLREKLHQLDKE